VSRIFLYPCVEYRESREIRGRWGGGREGGGKFRENKRMRDYNTYNSTVSIILLWP